MLFYVFSVFSCAPTRGAPKSSSLPESWAITWSHLTYPCRRGQKFCQIATMGWGGRGSRAPGSPTWSNSLQPNSRKSSKRAKPVSSPTSSVYFLKMWPHNPERTLHWIENIGHKQKKPVKLEQHDNWLGVFFRQPANSDWHSGTPSLLSPGQPRHAHSGAVL